VTDTSALLTIPDLLASERYKDSVLAQSGIRFYAGAPLTTREGYTLGPSACWVMSQETWQLMSQRF